MIIIIIKEEEKRKKERNIEMGKVKGKKWKNGK